MVNGRSRQSHRDGTGFTIVEVVIGVSLVALVLSMGLGFHVNASTRTVRSVEYTDALRSVVVATEHLRRDVEQMFFQCPDRDLALLDHPELGPHRGLSVRVPDPKDPADLWSAFHTPISYTLRKAPGAIGKAYQLVRQEVKGGRELVLRNCLLRDLRIEYVEIKDADPGGLSKYQRYLEITVIGLGTSKSDPRAEATYTASVLIPLALMAPAGVYEYPIGSL